MSEGRGTTKPFEYIGAPFIDGYRLAKRLNEKNIAGVLARPISFIPTYQKHKDQVCEGVQLHVVDRHTIHSLKAGLTLIETIAEMYPNQFEFVQHNGKYFFDLLAGTKELKNMVLEQKTDEFLQDCEKQLEMFKKQREPYLLY